MEREQIVELTSVIIILALSLSIHEAAHAWVAYRCGDTTARDEGRLTLNPLAHIDPFMTVILPAVLYATAGILFGGAKPVPVISSRLRNPSRDMMLVALAGPISNFLLAILFMLLWKVSLAHLGYERAQLLPQVLSWGVFTNCLLAAFNMLPIPPLDGSRVLSYLLPIDLRTKYNSLEQFGILIVIGVVWLVPGARAFLLDAMDWLWSRIDWLTGGYWWA